jgi:hypothetical protein
MLGVVAFRSREKIQWDAKKRKVVHSEAAQHFVSKEHRKGWEI